MKNFKTLILAFLLFTTQNLFSQIDIPSRVSFNYIDLLNYTGFARVEIAEKVKKAISNADIKFYSDAALKNELDFNELLEKITAKESILLSNPTNPDDPYDLIDTFVYYEAYPDDFVFANSLSVECINESGAKFYLSYKDVEKLLNKSHISTINYLKKNGITYISDKNLLPFAKLQIKKLGQFLYDYGMEEGINAYYNNYLNQVYSKKEIKDRVLIKTVKQIQNPENPDDIYDLIDTIIVSDYNPDSIKLIRLGFVWKTKNFEIKAKFHSIAPTFKPYTEGLILPTTPIFHIKAEDYLKTLSKDEKEFWEYFYTFLLQNYTTNGYYNYYTEENIEQKIPK
jgi:hypothetical protein